MPIFPGPVSHNNPNAPILKLDDKQVKGASIVANISTRNGIGANLRVEGYQAYVQSTDKTYAYVSSDMGDTAWQTETNWKTVSGDSFVFDQTGSPSTTWVVAHGLNKYPSVMVVDTDGDHIEGYTIVYDTVNQITLTFKVAGVLTGVAGTAYIN